MWHKPQASDTGIQFDGSNASLRELRGKSFSLVTNNPARSEPGLGNAHLRRRRGDTQKKPLQLAVGRVSNLMKKREGHAKQEGPEREGQLKKGEGSPFFLQKS